MQSFRIACRIITHRKKQGMQIITARTSNVRRVGDHQIIFGLVSFDTDQGQIHVEVTVQPENEAELAMLQALMIK